MPGHQLLSTTALEDFSLHSRCVTADPLRALAARMLVEEAPSLPDFPGRAWHEDSLAEALRTYAAIKGDELTPDILAACERVGRQKARLIAGREAA